MRIFNTVLCLTMALAVPALAQKVDLKPLPVSPHSQTATERMTDFFVSNAPGGLGTQSGYVGRIWNVGTDANVITGTQGTGRTKAIVGANLLVRF